MKASTGPIPTWRKWLYRLLGGFLVLGFLASIPDFLKVVAAFKLTWAAKGISQEAQARLLGYLTGQVVGRVGLLILGIWLLRRSWRKTGQPLDNAEAGVAEPVPVPAAAFKASRRQSGKRWSSCNVLLPGAQIRQLWQFNAGGNKFNLLRQESKPPGEPLSERLVANMAIALLDRSTSSICTGS